MTGSPILLSLERQYAIALGQYKVAEHAIEAVVGLKAVVAEDRRIQARKKALQAKMDHIAYLIRVQVDPAWEPGHVRALRSRQNVGRQGYIAKAVYRVLKNADSPLKVREIVYLILPLIDVEKPDTLQLDRVHSAVNGILIARLKQDMVFHDGGKPMRWSVKPRAARRQASDASASIPPILLRPALPQPAPAPTETADHCLPGDDPHATRIRPRNSGRAYG